ncbi:MAG: Rieske 2Fe-2S domain-containing protein [Myxococcota bacterium]|nr:Rieske 2Fe-2S domain-containing protein [Myxococcota bacterium]
MAREFPFPIPNGWFGVAFRDELAPGQVKPIHYFGEDLVLWRGDDGVARVLDAHCPHLGAHLGHGGTVEGDAIRCPFHGWLWDGAGSCREIPYAKRIPPKARMRRWEVRERGNLILVWRHAAGEPPSFEVPDVPEFESDAWTDPERREWIVRSRNQELAENTVDEAHFHFVHRTNTVPETESATIEGHLLHVVSRNRVETPRGEQTGHIDIQAHGFGYGTTRFSGIADLLVVTSGAPIDDERVHMRLQFAVKKLADSDATRGVGKAFISEIERQFGQDIPIWENKIHLERPLLCDGDGPIALLRQWAQQFYT